MMSYIFNPFPIPGGGTIHLPEIDKFTVIGITVAIAGNILISLALNLQKLAHRQRQLEAFTNSQDEASDHRSLYTPHARMERVREEGSGEQSQDFDHRDDRTRLRGADQNTYRSNLVRSSEVRQNHALSELNETTSKRNIFWSLFYPNSPSSAYSDGHILPMRASESTRLLPPEPMGSSFLRSIAIRTDSENESAYLKSRLWWTGFTLMNVGEMGNFISYAYAPASLVAPLGTFALVANCLFAPLILKERFRKVEILGIIIAIVGAVTVVLSANPSETRLDRDGLINAISQRPFIIYSAIYIVGLVILTGLSKGPHGSRWIFIDVGICALLGGFTVLSTKALSTLLTMEWIRIFTEWITFPIVIILIGSGVGQIKYLNRALMRFDSKLVVPTQFVFFNLSAILGSSILYGDFSNASFHQMVTFLYGCGATFGGVFIITWSGHSEASPCPENEQSNIDVAEPLTPGDPPPSRFGSMGRRNRSVENGKLTHVRPQRSSRILVGFSPAQRLLIHTPPRDDWECHNSFDTDQESMPTSDSWIGRRMIGADFDDDAVDRQHRSGASREW